jgi:hypothetical protein
MHATWGDVVSISSPIPISALENVQLMVVGGWQEGLAAATTGLKDKVSAVSP